VIGRDYILSVNLNVKNVNVHILFFSAVGF